MSISDHLDRLSESSVRHCKYVRFIGRLTEQDDPDKVEEFVGLVADRRISGPLAAKALSAELGEPISGDTVAKHLRGACGCTA